MIVDTTFQGRPARAMYMTTDFEPVDHEALATLVKVMFLDEEGGAIFLVPLESQTDGPSPSEKRARAKAYEGWKQRREFDESKHPRNPKGEFTSGGGGSGSADGAAPTGRPNFSAAAGTNAKKRDQVKAAVAAIPAKHAEAIKNVSVSLVPTVRDQSGKHTMEGWYDPDKRSIEIAEKTSFTFPKQGYFDRPKTYEIDVKDLERATIRELGYAYNHANDWSLNKAIQGELTAGFDRMTDTEKKDGAYFVNSSQDSFAELYALAHSPKKSGGFLGFGKKPEAYFGNMTRDRAEKVFAEALAKVKAM